MKELEAELCKVLFVPKEKLKPEDVSSATRNMNSLSSMDKRLNYSLKVCLSKMTGERKILSNKKISKGNLWIQ